MPGIVYEDGILSGEPPAVSGPGLACDRCGNFAPLSWSWGKRLCAECLARAHPALGTPSTVRTLIVEGWKLMPAVGLRGVATMLTLLPLTLALRAIWPAPDTDSMRLDTLHDLGPTTLLALPNGVAFAFATQLMLQVLVGSGRADHRLAWRELLERRWAVLTLSVVQSLLEDAAFIALQFVGMMLVTIPLSLAYPILLHERVSPWSALRRSTFRMRGNQLRVLGAVTLYSLSWIVLLIPIFIAADSNPALEQLSAAVVEGLSVLIALPIAAISVVLYGKLPPRMSEQSVRSSDS